MRSPSTSIGMDPEPVRGDGCLEVCVCVCVMFPIHVSVLSNVSLSWLDPGASGLERWPFVFAHVCGAGRSACVAHWCLCVEASPASVSVWATLACCIASLACMATCSLPASYGRSWNHRARAWQSYVSSLPMAAQTTPKHKLDNNISNSWFHQRSSKMQSDALQGALSATDSDNARVIRALDFERSLAT